MSTEVISESRLYPASSEVIQRHAARFLCDDSAGATNDSILIRADFEPDAFTVLDRLSANNLFLDEHERDGAEWLRSLVMNELVLAQEQGLVRQIPFVDVAQFCTEQVLDFFHYHLSDRPIAAQVTNQEAPDVVRRVVAHCIFGNCEQELYTHRAFNEFAFRVIPELIRQHLWNRQISLKSLLLVSIAGGSIGLDWKGGAVAASRFASSGIPVKPLLAMEAELIRRSLWNELNRCASRGLVIDHWEEFYNTTILSRCKITWFLDDVIESFFDLFLIQEMLRANPLLSVVIVPKSGRFGNDMGYQDAVRAIEMEPFDLLGKCVRENHVTVSPHGPSMGTVNLRKLSSHVVQEMLTSDCVLVKGCRAHELIQGGLNKVTYTAYVVMREFSESETGLDSRLSPLVFVRSSPGQNAYWGFRGRARRWKTMEDGRRIRIVYTTLEERERRRSAVDPRLMTEELDNLLKIRADAIEDGYSEKYHQEVKALVDRLADITRDAYNIMAEDYSMVRREEPHQIDVQLFDRLMEVAHTFVEEGRIGSAAGKLSLLDVGTGSGRDLRYIQRFADVTAIGIDNSETFVAILDRLARNGEIPPNSFFLMDMRDLQFDDCSFDIVRHNATLLHLPLVGPGLGVDVAVAESRRVLKPWGLLFVNVKAGQGMEFLDTKEGLGGRFFQFFSEDSLREVLTRNGFEVLEIRFWHEDRPSGRVDWVVAYAQKRAGSAS